MPSTEAAIVERARAVLENLGYHEAVGFDFTRQPTGAVDKRFIVRYDAQTPIGGIGLHEEAKGILEVELAREVNNDYQGVRAETWRRARAIVNALVEDGSTSGVYVVEDAGRTVVVDVPTGASYLVARARVPVNFDALL